jgi:hypothetical protein
MRPIAEIEADFWADPPPCADVAAWDAFVDAVTRAERLEMDDHAWLLVACEHLGHGPLEIPESIAEDAALTVRERFVLSALLDVARHVDTTTGDAFQAVKARLFGDRAEWHARIVGPALTSLVEKQAIVRAIRGGFVVGHLA